jgi:hypothetical protein
MRECHSERLSLHLLNPFHSEKAQEIKARVGVIDNIVASWAFGVAEQILDETNVSSLPKPSLDSPNSIANSEQLNNDKSFHPARSSSLSHRPNKGITPSKLEDTTLAVFAKLGQRGPADYPSEPTPAAKISDIESLAGYRAELYLLQRQIMERSAEANGWSIGLSKLRTIDSDQSTGMKDIDLHDDDGSADGSASSSVTNKDEAQTRSINGICQETLMSATTSLDEFKSNFEVRTLLDLHTKLNILIYLSFRNLPVLLYLTSSQPVESTL